MLADDIAWALPLLRAEAEARMLDTFTVGIPADGWVYDPQTQTEVQALDVLFVTAGRVKVGLMPREAEAGGRTVATVTRELHIPVDSPAVPAGAVAVCTAVHETSDLPLLGARLTLVGPAPGSQTTARRLTVKEDVS